MDDSVPVLDFWRSHIKRAARTLKQPLFSNAGYLLGVNIVGAVAGFVFWGLAGRLYKPDEIGNASAIVSAVALLSGLAGMGVGNGLVRFLPEARHPQRLLNSALSLNSIVAFLVVCVYLVGLTLWSPSLVFLRENGLYAAGFVAYTLAMTLGVTIQGVFVARRRAAYALLYTSVANVGRLILLGVLAHLGAVGLAGSVALAVVLAVVLSLGLFLPRVVSGYRPQPDLLVRDLAAVVPYSLGNYVANLLAQTPQWLLPLVVLEMLGPTSSGSAYIAWMLGSLLTSPGLALANSAFAEGSNTPQELSTVLSRSAVLGLALTVPAAILVGAAAPWILALFGPENTRQSTGLLRWLAGTAPLTVLVGLYFARLRVENKVGRLVLFSVLVAVATLGIAALYMPRFGIAASGYGWLVGNGLIALIMLWGGREQGAKRRPGRPDRTGVPGAVL